MQGFVFFEGPSLIDGEPIVGLATGLKIGSPNVKTGAMVQIYFLHPTLSPLAAVHAGEDGRICGSCRHRGKTIQVDGKSKNVERSCYVTLFMGPRVVYQSYIDGSYPRVDIQTARKYLKGRPVRLSAYGDPACLPTEILQELVAESASHTGYTHVWRDRPDLAALTMASCDSPQERAEAHNLGFRTFRVRTNEERVEKGEGQCPASHEMGKVTTCVACKLCNGQRTGLKGDITLLSHGTGSGHFNRLRASQDMAARL